MQAKPSARLPWGGPLRPCAGFDGDPRRFYNLSMQTYDLCLTWYWKYDEDFAALIRQACHAHGLSLCEVTPANLLESTTALYTGQHAFRALLDRASDDLRFEPIRRYAREHHLRRINPAELSHWSEDKATMHLELIQAGLHTPHTIILAPFIDQPLLPPLDLGALGGRFVLKPAVGGGGEGVVLNASTSEDIQRARLEFPDQKYLLQEHVEACLLHGQKAWFRVFYVGGRCLPCWWNPLTHAYAVLTPEEEQRFDLAPLRLLTGRIAAICRLDWFSTEIALTEERRFVVVDYVNDGIDTRLQSRADDGVPDEVMQQMAEELVRLVGG